MTTEDCQREINRAQRSINLIDLHGAMFFENDVDVTVERRQSLENRVTLYRNLLARK